MKCGVWFASLNETAAQSDKPHTQPHALLLPLGSQLSSEVAMRSFNVVGVVLWRFYTGYKILISLKTQSDYRFR